MTLTDYIDGIAIIMSIFTLNRSHRLYRAFYIPWLSRQHTSYADYALLKNRDLFSELKRNYIYSKATAAESM